MQEEMEVNDGSQLQIFDIIALPIFALLIATAFVTFQYPSNQPNLYFWGGPSLLSGEYYPLAVIFLIIIPALFIVTYFIPSGRDTWRQICYMFMAMLVLIAPVIWIAVAFGNLFNSIGTGVSQVGCGIMTYGFFVFTGYLSDYIFNSCMDGENSKIIIKMGAALPMFYFAAFLSLFAFIIQLLKRWFH